MSVECNIDPIILLRSHISWCTLSFFLMECSLSVKVILCLCVSVSSCVCVCESNISYRKLMEKLSNCSKLICTCSLALMRLPINGANQNNRSVDSTRSQQLSFKWHPKENATQRTNANLFHSSFVFAPILSLDSSYFFLYLRCFLFILK